MLDRMIDKDDCAVEVRIWLGKLKAALASPDASRFEELFTDEAYWRDIYALSPEIALYHLRHHIASELVSRAQKYEISNLVIDRERPSPSAHREGAEEVFDLFLSFDTNVGHVKALVNLVRKAEGVARARYLFTDLYGLKGGPPLSDTADDRGLGRGHDLGFESSRSGETWPEYRRKVSSFTDREPEVLIIGGGQSGLSLGARLARLGVDYLIIDRHQRAGDNWRVRYESLALHTPKEMSQLPYMPFPKGFPQFLPKDKFADWLESYVSAMDLNYWANTELIGGSFDKGSGAWRLEVRRSDGTSRHMRPTHVVLAVGGVGGAPKVPPLPGLDMFAGEVLHSARFKTGSTYRDSRVLVVGVGTSGHDIALDLHHNDCAVTMVQRNHINVVNLDVANQAYSMYLDPGQTEDEADQRFMSGYLSPFPVLFEQMRAYAAWADKEDDDLISGLVKRGLKIDRDASNGGWMMKFLQLGGRYYLNVGCSDVIVNGGIRILQASDVDHFTQKGLKRVDGLLEEYDVIVLATGYEDLNVEIEKLFGPEIAANVGTVTGFDTHGELRTVGRPTGQRNLWVISGGIVHARNISRVVSLQLKAHLAGLYS